MQAKNERKKSLTVSPRSYNGRTCVRAKDAHPRVKRPCTTSHETRKENGMTYELIFGWSGKPTGSSKIFWNVRFRDEPLNGVVAYCTKNKNKKISKFVTIQSFQSHKDPSMPAVCTCIVAGTRKEKKKPIEHNEMPCHVYPTGLNEWKEPTCASLEAQ